jgi:single-strand DNA-binding protein
MLTLALIGNLGNDPELRFTADGKQTLRFNVACNGRTRTPEGEYVDTTDWVRVTVFGERAERLAPYLHKGQRVYCDGRLQPRAWINQAGAPQSGLEILADTVEFMSPRETDQSQAPASQQAARPQPAAARPGRPPAQDDADDLDDLPF